MCHAGATIRNGVPFLNDVWRNSAQSAWCGNRGFALRAKCESAPRSDYLDSVDFSSAEAALHPTTMDTTEIQTMSYRTCRHWKIAECSESAGIMSTPCFLSRGSTAGPPAIRVSLLARAMVLLFLIASTVGSSPAQPTIPCKGRENERLMD